MTSIPFSYDHQVRSIKTGLVVGVVWALLLSAWIWLEAASWIILTFALFTLPALLDLIRNPPCGLHLDHTALSWHAGRHSGEVPLSEIAHVRLDTRLDFSVRASVVLNSGGKIRIPFEATPPHQTFEDALKDANLKVLRFHFQLFQ